MLRGSGRAGRRMMEPMSERRLPTRLLKRTASASRDVRLRTVDELELLCAGSDTALAAEARAALGRLTGDDSRKVSEAAAAAIARTTIRLDPDRVDFGHVLPGSARLVAEVTVAGRAATVSVSDPAVRAALAGDRLRVSWLPGAGMFHGSVTVSGPAGSADLVVSGQAGSASPASRVAQRRWTPVVAAATAVVLLLVGLGVSVASADRDGVSAPATVPVPLALSVGRPLPASTSGPSVIATIRVGAEPEGVVVSPDAGTVYVANQGSRVLSVIDARTREVTSVGLRSTARFVAVSRDGRQVFVSMYEDDLTGSGVAVVDAGTRRVIRYLGTGVQPYCLAVAPDGRLWVPIHGGRSVEIYTATDQRRVGRVLVPQNPHSVAFSADGQRAFTPDHESNSMSVIDMRTDRRITSIPVSPAPHSLAVTPDGRTVVVAAYTANAVDLIDAVTLRRRGPFRVGASPQSVTVSADGVHAYVVNEGGNSVSVVHTGTGAVSATVPVGRSPRTVAVASDGRFGYVTNGDDNTVSVLKVAG